MNLFEIYVHGTPRGHQIWGDEHNHDYISTFYNHDSQASEKVVLQIDVCAGYSFYTYLRHQNVFDVEGRPQAFFALTVSFHKAYCTNVYKLYQLFDAVYNQICVGSILKQTNNGDNFLVADFTAARSGANATVDKIYAAFTQKIGELIEPTLQPLTSGDTFNRAKKVVSLVEVDSPLFFDYFKKHSVVVSPVMRPAAIAYDAVAKELKDVSAQKKALSSANDQLQSDIASLSQENKSLMSQLQSSASSTEKKYRSKLSQIQTDLSEVTKERDSLKQKIEDASSSIELIDKPFQKLTRLLAGRFPETHASRRKEDLEDSQKNPKKNQRSIWMGWLNTILLTLVFVCCSIILVVVLNPHSNQNAEKNANETEGGDPNVTYAFEEEADSLIHESYDSWDNCFLDIKGGGDNLELNKTYILSVKTNSQEKANIPDGEWNVFVHKETPINNDNFIITDSSYKGKKLMIQYIVNGEIKKTRVCEIQ